MDEIMENITEENPEVKYKFVEPTDPNIAGLKKLQKVITELKVPKSGFNKFGGFSYRTLDDIIDGLRPLCIKYGIVYVIRDNVIFVQGRWYVVAYVHVYDVDTGALIVIGEGWAREADKKAKFDESQLTGASSTYARKYALCGVFDIAEGTDEDSISGSDSQQRQAPPPPQSPSPQQNVHHSESDVIELLNMYGEKTNVHIRYDNLMFVLYPNGVQPENIDYVFNNFTAAITEYNRRTQRT